MNILFVCTGNTCRSPMAEVILKTKKPGYHVLSAGLSAQNGAPINPMAKETLESHGLSEDHQAQEIRPELITWADYVFTMTATHKVMLEIAFPTHIDKIYTLKEFTKSEMNTSVDIADPYGGSMETYQETFQELQKLIDQAILKINNQS